MFREGTVKNCKAESCKQYSKKHNLLYLEDRTDSAQQRASVSNLNRNEVSGQVNKTMSSTSEQSIEQQSISTCSITTGTLLSTAIDFMARIDDNAGHKIEARALLNCGSQ